MNLEIVVSSPARPVAPRPDERTHVVTVDAAEITTAERLFDAFADAFDFPGYFGRNWNALDECFADYFDLTDGGLGSAYGGRVGVDADAVRFDLDHAGVLLRADLLDPVVSLLRYARDSNVDGPAADLLTVLHVADEQEHEAVQRVLDAG